MACMSWRMAETQDHQDLPTAQPSSQPSSQPASQPSAAHLVHSPLSRRRRSALLASSRQPALLAADRLAPGGPPPLLLLSARPVSIALARGLHHQLVLRCRNGALRPRQQHQLHRELPRSHLLATCRRPASLPAALLRARCSALRGGCALSRRGSLPSGRCRRPLLRLHVLQLLVSFEHPLLMGALVAAVVVTSAAAWRTLALHA